MATVAEIKAQYPQYRNVPDAKLAAALTHKFGAGFLTPDKVPERDYAAEQAQETSPFDAALISAGRTFSDIGQGAAQLATPLTSMLPEGRFKDAVSYAPDPVADKAMGSLEREHPISTAVGSSLPYMAAGAGTGMAMRGAGILPGMLGQAGTAGTIGAVQPGSMEERLARGGIDAAFGGFGEGVGRGIAGVAAPAFKQATGYLDDTINRARDLGYTVMPTTGAKGSGLLRQSLEGGIESTPGGGAVLGKALEGNQAIFNRHAAQALGETGADAPTANVLAAARDRIGAEFDTLMPKGLEMPVDDTALAKIADIRSNTVDLYIHGGEDPIRKALDNLDTILADGVIDASELMKQQSRLGRQAKAAQLSNPDLAHGLRDIQDTLLDLARWNMPDEKSAAFDTARQQWKQLRTLESGSNIDPVTGDVFPGRVAAFLQRRDVKGFTEGRNLSDFYEGARFLGRIQPKLKSSGTAERSLGGTMLGGGFGAMTGDDPSQMLAHGAAGAGAGFFGPAALAKAYLRAGKAPGRYLARESSGTLEDQIMRALGREFVRPATPRD